MGPSAHAVSLVSQLGRRLGIHGLAFDEYNLCHVRVDGVFIDIQFDAEKNALLISSEVAAVASASAADIYAYLLELNLVAGMVGWRGFVGLNRRSEQLFYIDRIAAQELTDDAFEHFIRSSARQASAWTRLVNSPDFQGDALSRRAPEESRFSLMQV